MADHVFSLIEQEQVRQETGIQLIPSENMSSKAVRQAVGSCLMNKYSEGYPHARYYEGNDVIDEIELLAIDRAKKLFGVPHANVQPYSGSPANAAVEFAILEPGDTVMGMALSSGGHLTHGHPKVTFSGKYFRSVQYAVDANARIDLVALRALAKAEKPKLMIIGTTAYPFELPFKEFAEIAAEVNAYVLADISHIAGLVIAGVHPSPVPYVDVVMTTTHKTLRGPRGAMILVTEKGLTKDPDLAKKIDKAVFPGLQGGPHNNVTAGIAVALAEAATPEYNAYAKQIVKNAAALAAALKKNGIKLVGGGTENHLMIMDFSEWGGGTQVAYAMALAGLYANKNTVPKEPNSPFYPSGVRMGTPWVTTIGMKEPEMEQIAAWIAQIVEVAKKWPLPKAKEERKACMATFRTQVKKEKRLQEIREQVRDFTTIRFTKR
jgi:glycine hydroxymethyltransferase